MAERSPSQPSLVSSYLRRLPSRTLLLIAFCLGIVALALTVVPFNATAPDGTALHCGPPLFEVIVPPDPAFDAPENDGCAQPAKRRLMLGGLLFGGAVVVAFVTQRRARQGTIDRQAVWLAGGSRRLVRKAREQFPELSAAEERAIDDATDDADDAAAASDGADEADDDGWIDVDSLGDRDAVPRLGP